MFFIYSIVMNIICPFHIQLFVNMVHKDYCKPMKTLTVDRVEFLRKEQSKDESFEDY